MSEWIPVSERLPDENGWYLVSIGDTWTEEGLGRVDDPKKIYDCMVRFSSFENGKFYFGRVAAWMPKPKPYRGE